MGEVVKSGSGPVIRSVTAMDAVNIVRLLKTAWEESKEVQLSRVNSQKLLEYVIESIKQSFVAVADLSGRLTGIIICKPVQERWSDDWFLCSEHFYVLPTHRTRGTALKLRDTAEQFADRCGWPLVLGVHTVEPERVDLLFANRRGYRYVGGNYMRMPQVNHDGKQEDHHDEQHSELPGGRVSAGG